MMDFDFKSEYFNFEGQQIHFVRAGSGPAMIFMHNGGADTKIWVRQLGHFQKDFQVIAFDFLGYGKSDRPDRPYTAEDQTKQLAALIKHLNLSKPILVGNCVGASTAIEFAKQNPEQASKLILFNICGGASFALPMKLVEYLPALAKIIAWILSFKTSQMAKFLWGPSPKIDDPLYQHYLQNIFKHPKFMQSRVNMFLGTKTFDIYGKPMQLPTNFPPNLLVWGEENKLMRIKYSSICRSYLPHSSFCSVANAGHLCFYEQAKLVNEKMERFLH